jgi:hypothetical protein
MSDTGKPGIPFDNEGYKKAEQYGTDPTTEILPNWLSQDVDNAAKAYFISQIKDIWDTLVSATPISAGVLLFPQETSEDLIVPAGFNAITAIDAIGEGFEIEVADGSKLYHIDEEEFGQMIEQIRVSTQVSLKDYSGDYTPTPLDFSWTLKHTGPASSFIIDDDATRDWTGGTAVYGQTLTLTNRGTGTVTIVAGGSTLFSTSDLVVPVGVAVTLMYDDFDQWLVIGATIA